MEQSRDHYLDNLRVLLTALVILHHAFVCYGAPGGWYYKEPVDEHSLAAILMTFFVATNKCMMKDNKCGKQNS